MSEQEIVERLKSEGYDNVWVYEAQSNEVDEEHSHDYDTKLHILSGDITVSGVLYQTGQEVEILRDKKHEAQVGLEGCRYVVAEKHS